MSFDAAAWPRPVRAGEVVHGCPASGSSRTTCCGAVVFELSTRDRITTKAAQITCRGPRREARRA